MLNCSACNQSLVVESINGVKEHLNHHLRYGQLRLPIQCCQNSVCKASFGTVSNYTKHFKLYHSSDIYIPPLPTNNHISNGDEMECMQLQGEDEIIADEFIAQGESPLVSFKDSMQNLASAVHDSIFLLIAELRSKGSVTYSCSLKVVDIISTVIDTIVDKTLAGFDSEFCGVIDPLEIPAKIQTIKSELANIKTVPLAFNSEFKISQLFQKHPLFVKPVDLLLSQTVENVPRPEGVQTVQKFSIAQYIPIKKTVGALLSVTEYVNLIFPVSNNPDSSVDGEYRSFKDGSKFKTIQSNAAQEQKEYNLLFQLYEDGTGLTNPLASSSTTHSSGIFAFSLLNFENAYNASIDSIHVIAMAKNSDLKEGGMDDVLECIIQEINEFSRTGIEYDVAGRGKVRVYGSLCHFTGDNLAINQVFGMVEAFTGDYCCPICYADREQIQNCTREIHFKIRNPTDYRQDCDDLEDSSALHVRGVKKYCKLNDISSYHITDNWICEVMHTVLQGIIPHCMSIAVYDLWKEGLIDV